MVSMESGPGTSFTLPHLRIHCVFASVRSCARVPKSVERCRRARETIREVPPMDEHPLGPDTNLPDTGTRDHSPSSPEQRGEQFLRAVIDSALDAFISIDQHGVIVEWNRQAESMFGWSRDEAVGRAIAETIIPVHHRQAHTEGLKRLVETGEGTVLNRRLTLSALRRDGTEFPVELAISNPIQVGPQHYIHAFVRDATEHNKVVGAVRVSEALYHSLVDCLPIHVTRSNLEGRIIYANKTFCDMVGVREQEILGKTNRDLSPPEMAEKYDRDDRRVAETGEVFADIEENTIAGKDYFFELRKTPVRDATGKIVATQAIFWDVTEREQARAALARSHRDLDEFVAVVSHDLHAPMRAVVSYCQLLQQRYKGQPDDVAEEYVRYVMEGAKRMQTLIDALRRYARVTRKDTLHRPVDCERVLADAESNLEVEIKERTATVTHDPLPTVKGDPTQLMQLFQNLIGNAIKYCQQSRPMVHVRAEESDDAWQFSVRDNGIGIDLTKVKDIFRIFQRLHSEEAEFSGTGIGLATCKRIVERHGGEIHVESNPGEGSVFRFTVAKG